MQVYYNLNHYKDRLQLFNDLDFSKRYYKIKLGTDFYNLRISSISKGLYEFELNQDFKHHCFRFKERSNGNKPSANFSDLKVFIIQSNKLLKNIEIYENISISMSELLYFFSIENDQFVRCHSFLTISDCMNITFSCKNWKNIEKLFK